MPLCLSLSFCLSRPLHGRVLQSPVWRVKIRLLGKVAGVWEPKEEEVAEAKWLVSHPMYKVKLLICLFFEYNNLH